MNSSNEETILGRLLGDILRELQYGNAIKGNDISFKLRNYKGNYGVYSDKSAIGLLDIASNSKLKTSEFSQYVNNNFKFKKIRDDKKKQTFYIYFKRSNEPALANER